MKCISSKKGSKEGCSLMFGSEVEGALQCCETLLQGLFYDKLPTTPNSLPTGVLGIADPMETRQCGD
jgi:hypothetical protein